MYEEIEKFFQECKFLKEGKMSVPNWITGSETGYFSTLHPQSFSKRANSEMNIETIRNPYKYPINEGWYDNLSHNTLTRLFLCSLDNYTKNFIEMSEEIIKLDSILEKYEIETRVFHAYDNFMTNRPITEILDIKTIRYIINENDIYNYCRDGGETYLLLIHKGRGYDESLQSDED